MPNIDLLGILKVIARFLVISAMIALGIGISIKIIGTILDYYLLFDDLSLQLSSAMNASGGNLMACFSKYYHLLGINEVLISTFAILYGMLATYASVMLNVIVYRVSVSFNGMLLEFLK